MLLRIARNLHARMLIARDPIKYARGIGAKIGDDCRLLGVDQATFGSEPYLISLGHHVTVTAGTRFITHDGGIWVLRHKYPDIEMMGRITIHDNVFIGLNAIIMPNVEVGANSVIAAGAVVTRSIPPNTIAAGVPAKPLKTVGEYEANVLPRALHVRSRPMRQRRLIYEDIPRLVSDTLALPEPANIADGLRQL